MKLKHSYTGTWGRVVLKPLEDAHIEDMRVLRNRNRSNFVYSGEIGSEEQKAWYQKYLETPDDYMFSVYRADTDKWIGAVSIYQVKRDRKEAEFGRLLIDRQLAGEGGLGTDTTICACTIACSYLQIERIFLEVYESNISAIKTYLRAGFRPYCETVDSVGKKLICMKYNMNGEI